MLIDLIAFAIFLLGVAAFLSGCGHAHAAVSDPTSYGNAVTRIEMRAADGAAAARKIPDTSLRGQVGAYFDQIRADATETRKTLTDSAAANQKLADANAKKDREISRLNQALKDERGHWIGYQLRLWGKIIAGVGVALWLASGVVSAYLPTGWAGTLIHALPLANPFAWLRGRILKPGPAAAGA